MTRTRTIQSKAACIVAIALASICPIWNQWLLSWSCNGLSPTPSLASKITGLSNAFDLPSSANFLTHLDAVEVSSSDPVYSIKASRMAKIAGDIYESNLEDEMYELGETLIANGTSADVIWIVTDSIDSSFTTDKLAHPILVRTITMRGYHAADNRVDRLGLLKKLCDAKPVSIRADCRILVHSGLWDITQYLYKDLSPFMKGLSKRHKLVFNGHSIGGSLAVLFLIHATLQLGAQYIQDKVLHVYTFGSPPVTCLEKVAMQTECVEDIEGQAHCNILSYLGLPSTLVKGYTQPWDPITRIFSSIDSLYPIVDDIDIDGVTVWKTGPPRTLRPLLKKLLESWEDWPQTRNELIVGLKQDYSHVGIQHILMPNPIRYLSDRILAVSIAVPPINTIIQLKKSKDLLPVLNFTFPLDTFSISTVPIAMRSFVHHFYPAYSMSLVAF